MRARFRKIKNRGKPKPYGRNHGKRDHGGQHDGPIRSVRGKPRREGAAASDRMDETEATR